MNLNRFPPEHVLSNDLVTEKDPEMIEKVLKSMTPERSIVAVRYCTQEKSVSVPVETNLCVFLYSFLFILVKDVFFIYYKKIIQNLKILRRQIRIC